MAFAADGVLEALLERADEKGISAGGRRVAGDGNFAAEVPLGEVRHLDVAPPEGEGKDAVER